MPVVSAAGPYAPVPALGRAPPGASDQPRAPGWCAARVRRIDGAGRTAEVREGFEEVRTHRDLAGHERCTEGRWPSLDRSGECQEPR
jgi:hypothetical protein